MNEHEVMAIVGEFQEKYLKNQTLMGFAVVDEARGIIIASTFDQHYSVLLTNPVKSWVVYEGIGGTKAFELKSDDDFRDFVFDTAEEAACA